MPFQTKRIHAKHNLWSMYIILNSQGYQYEHENRGSCQIIREFWGLHLIAKAYLQFIGNLMSLIVR